MDRMAETVAENWRYTEKKLGPDAPVSIDYEQLDTVIEEHTPKALATTSHLPPMPGAGSRDPAVAISYILAGNALNFHYKTPGTPPYRVLNPSNPEKPFEGFMAFWHKLYQRLGERVITADVLSPYVKSEDAIREFFSDLTEIPLPGLRRACWQDYISGLRHHDGNPLKILSACYSGGAYRAFNAGRGLVELLAAYFPVAYGSDWYTFSGKHYGFFKKARLVAVILHQYALQSDGRVPLFADAHEICPPMDYQHPRILHSPAFRVLRYSAALEEKIEKGEEIPLGSREEIMIRGGGVAAYVYWQKKKPNVPGPLLDEYMFANSRGLPNKAHYTTTSNY